jgi:hypothetical protein
VTSPLIRSAGHGVAARTGAGPSRPLRPTLSPRGPPSGAHLEDTLSARNASPLHLRAPPRGGEPGTRPSADLALPAPRRAGRPSGRRRRRDRHRRAGPPAAGRTRRPGGPRRAGPDARRDRTGGRGAHRTRRRRGPRRSARRAGGHSGLRPAERHEQDRLALPLRRGRAGRVRLLGPGQLGLQGRGRGPATHQPPALHDRQAKADLQPGDLVFFYRPISHVAIYIGDGKVVHASNRRDPVKISNLAAMPFTAARRV